MNNPVEHGVRVERLLRLRECLDQATAVTHIDAELAKIAALIEHKRNPPKVKEY